MDALEITPQDARSQLAGERGVMLIDVREPVEFAIARIEGSLLIPMQSVPSELPHLEALADDKDLLVVCHHGVRSLQVVNWLRHQGLVNCVSVSGGIDRWSREIDGNVPRY